MSRTRDTADGKIALIITSHQLSDIFYVADQGIVG
jgi:hypothetical protein